MIIGKSLGITDKDEAYRIGKICDLSFGYLGGLKAYRNFAPVGDTSTDSEIYEKRNAWQARHPKVVEFWHSFNNLAVNAVQKPNVPFGYNKIKLVRTADFLHVQLPSGRFIHYPDPSITNTTRYGEDAVIFKDNAGGRWGDYYKGSAHGGTWAENIVSGFSRDILAEAMKRVEAAGYKIILTVHDEIVAEMRDGHGSLKEFQRLIEIVPGWAPGLPIMAKVREGTRWSKPDKAKTAIAQVESAAVAQIEVKSAAAAPEPESAPASGAGAGVLLAITPAARVRLRDLGYGAAAITRMTPAQAKAAIEDAFAPIPEMPPRRRSPASPAGCADPLRPPPEAPPAAPEPRPEPLRADREQIAAFVQTLFRRAHAGIVNLRTYKEGKAGAAKGITPIQIATGDSVARFDGLIAAATQAASQAARSMIPLVFSPPVCVFAETAGWHAREEDLAEGVVLTVECDARPSEARSKLEAVLGPATMIVASGGTWINGGSAPEDKFHLHWRLAVPARGDDLPRLKEARRLAAATVGADVSSVPIVHPLRWPGSWHRKKAPRLCKILVNNADREINLDIALSTLRAAAVANNVSGADTNDRPRAEGGETGSCWDALDDPIDHAKLTSAAMSLALAGMYVSPGAMINLLRHRVEQVDPTSEEGYERKQRRLYELPGIVNSAVKKARKWRGEDVESEDEDQDEEGEAPGQDPPQDQGEELSPDQSQGDVSDKAGSAPEGANGAQPAQAKPAGSTIEWPTLGEAAYRGLAGRVVKAIEPHTEADPVAMLMQFLVSAGNSIGRYPYYLVDGAEHYPVLYTLIVGSTAKGRKGTSAQRIRRIFDIADPQWVENNIANGIASGEGILHAIRDEHWRIKKGKRELLDHGVADKRLMIEEREFSSPLDKMRREGNVIEHTLREAWDCPKILQTLNKHSPTNASKPHISVVGHITVDELRRKVDRVSMANGFANRFLFTYVRRGKLLPHGGDVDEAVMNELGEETRAAIVGARLRKRVTMTPAAHEWWKEVYRDLQVEAPGLCGYITARGDAQTLRLSLMYALLDQAEQIDCVHIKAALAVWEFCAGCAQRIFGDATGDPLADAVLLALRAAGKKGMSRRQISDHFSHNVQVFKIQAALGTLLAAGKAHSEIRKPQGAGRPAEVWVAD
jgi:hypothetical protein